MNEAETGSTLNVIKCVKLLQKKNKQRTGKNEQFL